MEKISPAKFKIQNLVNESLIAYFTAAILFSQQTTKNILLLLSNFVFKIVLVQE